MKLLSHISYYSSNKREDERSNFNKIFNISKGSYEWQEHIFKGVLNVICELNKYDFFDEIDIIIDANEENEWCDKLLLKTSDLKKVNVEIKKYSFDEEHPFQLTFKHREDMLNKINDYDWFMYTEDDTIIPYVSMKNHFEKCEKLYMKKKLISCFNRLVYNEKQEFFHSDNIKEVRSPLFIDEEIGYIAIPYQSYCACWCYPKMIMKDFIESDLWKKAGKNHNGPGGVRVDSAYGYLPKKQVIILDDNQKNSVAWCVHLGLSGKYYFTVKENKFNKLRFKDENLIKLNI